MSAPTPLSANQRAMLDLALACDLKAAKLSEHDGIRARHKAISSEAAAAQYIAEVESKIHGRRHFPPAQTLRSIVPEGETRPLPPSGVHANPDWHSYRAGEGDRAARKIDKVYALDDNYVIYFSGCEMFYEVTHNLEQSTPDLGAADASLARINRLLSSIPVDPNKPDSDEYRHKLSTLELVADAYEMIFCGHVTQGLGILSEIIEKLQTVAQGTRRLFYQSGSIIVTLIGWAIYLDVIKVSQAPQIWQTWVLAAALAMAGGIFSVCLNLGSLQVTVNQQPLFLLVAGATRSVVALLAGVGLLLAMRSKMLAGFAYSGVIPDASAVLNVPEMFFCFLAGFSETFVPNILRDAEQNPGGGSHNTTNQSKPAPPNNPAGPAAAVPSDQPAVNSPSPLTQSKSGSNLPSKNS